MPQRNRSYRERLAAAICCIVEIAMFALIIIIGLIINALMMEMFHVLNPNL